MWLDKNCKATTIMTEFQAFWKDKIAKAVPLDKPIRADHMPVILGTQLFEDFIRNYGKYRIPRPKRK